MNLFLDQENTAKVGRCVALSIEVKVVGSANDSNLCNCSENTIALPFQDSVANLHPRALQMREVVKAPDSPNDANFQSGRGRGNERDLKLTTW